MIQFIETLLSYSLYSLEENFPMSPLIKADNGFRSQKLNPDEITRHTSSCKGNAVWARKRELALRSAS
jgi:hypothetical protein